MSDPTTLAEFNARYLNNQALTGMGLETTVHMPCPFCAAPDWKVYRLLAVEEAFPVPSTCKACGRSARFATTSGHGVTNVELVSTDDRELPAWMEGVVTVEREKG